ncbi:MAG: PHP domain-containing protein, partial [Chloroflexi bacterium]|nr:PHP domain-containing protein [Chloroflexota bacterium]
MYAELHCHSNYSFHEGASHVEELVLRARELGYAALALTDHDNLCGAMAFAQAAKALDVKPLIGCEITLDVSGFKVQVSRGSASDGNLKPETSNLTLETHVTLIAATLRGYNHLCRLLSHAHVAGDRRRPHFPVELLAEHSEGLILLSGCRQGEIPRLAAAGHLEAARQRARQYLEWFGPEGFYLELQDNLVRGDGPRNARLAALGRELGIPLVATNNVHYHVRERHRLQDALVAIQHNKS